MRGSGGAPDAREDGFSLPELLVTITLLFIVSAAVISSVVAIQRNLGAANATMNDMGANRIAIERIGSLLRGGVGPDGTLGAVAAAVVTAQPGRVELFTATGREASQNPHRVRLSLEGTDLVERIWSPVPDRRDDLAVGQAPTYPGPSRARVIARDLLSAAVFTYVSHRDGGSVGDRCGRVVTEQTAAARASIDAVSFRLQVQEPTAYDAAPSDLQGWARFASRGHVGLDAIGAACLPARGFGYDDAYLTP